jgi:ribosomal protein S18 acetylase RimI-like enzyme
MRLTEPADAGAVLDLLSEAATWTAANGRANWPARFPTAIVERGIERGELFVAELDGELVATLALQWSDRRFWGEQPPDAGYVHRLAVRRAHAGRGLGADALEWASAQVRERDRRWLRLDVPADNLPLGAYYERLGFRPRGQAEGELTDPDGRVVQWMVRRFERDTSEERNP